MARRGGRLEDAMCKIVAMSSTTGREASGEVRYKNDLKKTNKSITAV